MDKNSIRSKRSLTRYIGLDLSDKESSFLGITESGEETEEGKVRMTRGGLERAFSERPACRIAIEVGTHSPWVSAALGEMGHEVIIANPRQVALIHRSRRKSDRIDAQTLARLARADSRLLYPIRHRGKQAQLDLAVLRAREALVSSRTQLINHVRSVVKGVGERLASCSADAFATRAAEDIPPELRPALEPLVEQIAALTASIKGYDRQLEAMLERYGATRLLRQVNGVGPLTALAYLLTIEHPSRFSRSRDVGAYLGLTAGRRQTGASDPELHITKAGDVFLRKTLVQAAHYVMGPFGQDSDLRRWGQRLAGVGSKQRKKKAVVAVARKLAVLLHALWQSGEVYEPLRQAQRKEAGEDRRRRTAEVRSA